jgi:hypothetical protein
MTEMRTGRSPGLQGDGEETKVGADDFCEHQVRVPTAWTSMQTTTCTETTEDELDNVGLLRCSCKKEGLGQIDAPR